MVGKIIALAIAFILMLAVPLYDVITKPASPVEYGAGNGESQVIEDPEQLQELLNNIPNVDAYLENANILDVYPDFKSFTMVESGFARTTTTTSYSDSNTESVSEKNHILEMCYAENALYYHAVGKMTEKETVSVYNEASGNTNYESGTRTITSYDIEIYYSSELVMVKFNAFDILQEELVVDESSLLVTYREVEEEEGALSTSRVLETYEKCFGQWMELKTPTEEELMTKFEGMSEEEMQIEYTVYMLCETFSTAYIDDINASNQLNAQYLVSLSNFLTDNIDTAFEKTGNLYDLKSDEETKIAYLGALGLEGGYKEDTSSADASFTVNSTEVGVSQECVVYTDYGRTVEMETFTSFKNVNNTVANVKNADVKTVYDTLHDPFSDLIKEYMEEQSNG